MCPENSSHSVVGIHKDLQREKGKARPDVSFIIQLSARETDADGNAKIALSKAITNIADTNVGSVDAATASHGMEIGATPTIVGHLSTLSERLGAMSVITDKVEFLAEVCEILCHAICDVLINSPNITASPVCQDSMDCMLFAVSSEGVLVIFTIILIPCIV